MTAKLRVVLPAGDVLLKARSGLPAVEFSNIVQRPIEMTWPGLAVDGANKCRSNDLAEMFPIACVLGRRPIAERIPEKSSMVTSNETVDFLIFLIEAAIGVGCRY